MTVAVGWAALPAVGAAKLRGRPESVRRRLAVADAQVDPGDVERWAVKTLADRRAGLVNLKPRTTTIRALRRLRRPAEPTSRSRGVETRTYRVRARLVAAKLEDDSDVHLVIADPATGGTMI